MTSENPGLLADGPEELSGPRIARVDQCRGTREPGTEVGPISEARFCVRALLVWFCWPLQPWPIPGGSSLCGGPWGKECSVLSDPLSTHGPIGPIFHGATPSSVASDPFLPWRRGPEAASPDPPPS